MEGVSLQDLTGGYESGIVVYLESMEGIVLNWTSFEENRLPVLAPGGLFVLPWPYEIGDAEIKKTEKEDVRYDLDGVEIIWDQNDDIPGLLENPYPGTVYTINDEILVITPDDWN